MIHPIVADVLQKSPHQQRVEDFNIQACQEVLKKPGIPALSTVKLRALLILEECLETIRGLGYTVAVPFDGIDVEVNMQTAYLRKDFKPELTEIIDGCCDIRVVTTGCLSAFGIADEYPQYIVDMNNLAKFGPGCSWSPEGKLIKPPTHRPPDIQEIIDLQCEAVEREGRS